MAYVREETKHEDFPATLTVVQRRPETGECIPNWEFISLEWDGFQRLTPKQLRELGKWLVQEGKRIGKEYKCNGAKKKSVVMEKFTDAKSIEEVKLAFTEGREVQRCSIDANHNAVGWFTANENDLTQGWDSSRYRVATK